MKYLTVQNPPLKKVSITNNSNDIEWIKGSDNSNVVIKNSKLNVQILRYKISAKDSNKGYDTICIRESINNSVVVIENQNNEIGLIYEWRPIPEKWFWACVRGFAEKKDKNPISTAKREILEEVGLKNYLKIIDLGIYYQNTTYFVNPIKIVLIEVKSNLNFKLQENEGIINFNFFSIKEIYKMISKSEINCQHTLAALMKYFAFKNKIGTTHKT